MKKSSVQKAYGPIRPDEASKNRMLTNILLSSEISSTGKDERTMPKKTKPMLIAAIIALMLMLMGCAVAVYKMQDMKIGEVSFVGEILDSEGNRLKEKEMVSDVLSLHGIINSPTFLAHQEWFTFYEEYSRNHEITEEENHFRMPEQYEAYPAYNQELMDKIDEIAGKYKLNLLGAFAPFQRWENSVFYEATGINRLLLPNSGATIEEESGYFYEAGNFKVEFGMTMPQGKDHWPHEMLNSIYYSEQDNFDEVPFYIQNPSDWEEWHYTASSGAELLMIRHKSGVGARIFCVREDAIISISVDASEGSECMTKKQLEQVAEQFDYSVKVESVDMDIAKENLERFNPSKKKPEYNSGVEYSSIDNYIAYLITMQNAKNLYYLIADLDNDGTEDLMIGDAEKIESVWMMIDGKLNLIVSYGDNYRKLEEAWPNMEKRSVVNHFEGSTDRDKYGYQRYVLEVLSMEHPENTLFVLKDINDDGTLELLIGDQEILSYVYRVSFSNSGHPNIGVLSYSFTEEQWDTLRAEWLTMDRKPITEYFAQ